MDQLQKARGGLNLCNFQPKENQELMARHDV